VAVHVLCDAFPSGHSCTEVEWSCELPMHVRVSYRHSISRLLRSGGQYLERRDKHYHATEYLCAAVCQ
jgi:hypothetical protein